MFNNNQQQSAIDHGKGNRMPASIAAVLAAAAMGIVLHALYGHSWNETSGHAIGSDDAYISYRYALNFFKGAGLVFNPGEYVEGYSNFLYVLLVTPALLVSQDFIYPFSMALNILLFMIAALLFHGFLSRSLGRRMAIAGTALLAINPFIWANAATGLETMLVLVSILLAWILAERYLRTESRRDLHLLIAALVLSILCRIDGFLLPMLVVVYLAAKSKYRAALACFAGILISMGLYTLWRLYYYDDIIGNTYYAKVSGPLLDRFRSGLTYFMQNMPRGALWVYFAAIAAAVFGLLRRPAALFQKLNFAILYCTAWLAYLLYIGGDIYFERFFIGIYPMGIFLLLSACATLRMPPQMAKALLGVLLFLQLIPVVQDGRFSYASQRYDGWKTLGEHLRKHHPGQTLAIDAAGKVPYFSNLTTIDMLGLNDKTIGKKKIDTGSFHAGHNKFDPQYVLSKKPDLIAAWILPSLDMAWGLTHNVIRDAYTVRYLVNLSRDDRGERNIIDVSGLPDESIKKLIASGYGYAVLGRKTAHGQAGNGRP
ncbi:hypothetical protein RY831_27500 [Noviherbaspirillum sp. CPCC 100848]|uniref:Glycosyltransferase RgtA/B/C/D-like domain-containing protein n=1 Tax=Noviherbaspirillum album TaxID=3080276 RepID=A0ABU6JIL1_9BURK|nr:hypothetical protein [Noviherbaspirillum sp. CPCC 100848]MEC4722909.1 hypothetical protein [Noviherbaspirillum sp. CPCC 100848]